MITARSTYATGRANEPERLIHVIQGEYAIVDDPDAILSTLLGSCVAVCMRDPVARVGGMNHFLLPGDTASGSDSVKYGINAMELLVNGILQRGGMRSRLEAKLFGGAHVVRGVGSIGEQNAIFAERFLETEGIRSLGGSLGGGQARRLRYWPATGRARQLLIAGSAPELLEADIKKPSPPPVADAGAVELF